MRAEKSIYRPRHAVPRRGGVLVAWRWLVAHQLRRRRPLLVTDLLDVEGGEVR